MTSFLDALTDPGVDALLGMSQGFAQAAMPTRMPTPWGAVLGMGAGGALAGAQAGQKIQLADQQTQAAKMANMVTASSLPLLVSKNQMLGNLWSHPDQMQQMINGGSPASGGVPPSTGASAAADGTLPLSTFVSRVNGSENSTGNPAALNASGPGGTPTSTAMGNGQFIEGTWLPLFKKTFPERAAGMSDSDILAARAEPATNATMTRAYAQQNAPVLQAAGVQPSAATLAMAHRYGPDGAVAIAQAPPGTPLAKVLGADAMKANPSWQNLTTSGVTGAAAMRYGTAPIDFSSMTTSPTGASALNMANQYEQQANQLERQQQVAKFMQSQGLPAFAPPGDAATLRAAAGQYRALALAGPTAMAQAPGALAQKGFTVGANGALIPTPGGPADPAYVGAAKASEAMAQAAADRTKLITTRAGVFDPVTGKEIYRQPEFHELQDENGREYPAYTSPNESGGLTIQGGPPNVQPGTIPPSKLGPGQEDTIKHLADQYAKEDKQKYEGATNSLFQLGQQDQNISALNSGGGWSATGTGANTKLEWAKAVNSVAQTLGIQPVLDPSKVASWEDATKIQTQLAFAQAKQLGSREAQQVISMSRAATPGAENTPEGYKAISAGYHEMNNREVDLYNYKTQWLQSHGGNLLGAETAFNNQFTPQMYADRARSIVDPPSITANSLTDAMAKSAKFLPGTHIMLNGQPKTIPDRPGVPVAPDYVTNYLSAPGNANGR